MEDKIKSFWANRTKEYAEKAFNRALIIIMLLEFVGTMAIYMLLRTYASFMWAETWLVFVYAFTLKSYIDLLASSLKEKVMERIGYGKKEENLEDNTQEDSQEQDINN